MRNEYRIEGDTTVILCRRATGNIIETLIDTVDIPRADAFQRAWNANWYPTVHNYRISGHITRNKRVLLYRWLLDPPAHLQVDHINRNTLDNRRLNLRLVTNAENHQNLTSATSTNRTSGVRGVVWSKMYQAWVVSYKLNQKYHHVGRYDDLDEAIKASVEARRKAMPFSTEDFATATGSSR